MKWKSGYSFIAALCIVITIICSVEKASAQLRNIKNDVFWNTRDGKPIYSQGGGIFRFADPATGKKKYYWYGVHYLEAESYRKAPFITQTVNTFESVTCYASSDLVNWTFMGDVLTKAEVNRAGKTWVGRLGVAWIDTLKKYALFVQHGSKVLICL